MQWKPKYLLPISIKVPDFDKVKVLATHVGQCMDPCKCVGYDYKVYITYTYMLFQDSIIMEQCQTRLIQCWDSSVVKWCYLICIDMSYLWHHSEYCDVIPMTSQWITQCIINPPPHSAPICPRWLGSPTPGANFKKKKLCKGGNVCCYDFCYRKELTVYVTCMPDFRLINTRYIIKK